MIHYRKGNLLEQSDLSAIVHQCNLMHIFGAGIALEIKETFPEAYEADKQTPKNDISKLGKYSYAITPTFLIFNMYSQLGLSRHTRTTSYSHMEIAFKKIKNDLQNNIFGLKMPITLGMPYKIGCGLGGGNWEDVEKIIKNVFTDATFDVIICEL